MNIVIIDKEHNREVHYNNLQKIIIKDGEIRILDKDFWGTLERLEDYEFVIEDE